MIDQINASLRIKPIWDESRSEYSYLLQERVSNWFWTSWKTVSKDYHYSRTYERMKKELVDAYEKVLQRRKNSPYLKQNPLK